MEGIKVIRYLLANNSPLIAVVAASKITAGVLPYGTSLPAIQLTHISTVWDSEISAQSEYGTSRVQVTVLADDYPQQYQVMDLVLDAITRTRGTINGVNVDCIIRDSGGQDFSDNDAGIFMQTQDYFVKYNR